MKNHYSITKVILILILILGLQRAYSQQGEISKNDSTSISLSQSAVTQPDDDFSVFLLVMGTVTLCFMIGLVIAGTLFTLFILMILFALVSWGVVASSILIGLYKRSFSSGFKAFTIIACSLCGLISGAIVFLFCQRLFQWEITESTSLLSGCFTGLIGGLILGYITTIIIRIITLRTKNYFAVIKR